MARKVEESEMAKAIFKHLHLEEDPRLEIRIAKTEFYRIMRTAGLGSQNTTLQGMWYRFTESEFTYTEGGVDSAVLNIYVIRLLFPPKKAAGSATVSAEV